MANKHKKNIHIKQMKARTKKQKLLFKKLSKGQRVKCFVHEDHPQSFLNGLVGTVIRNVSHTDGRLTYVEFDEEKSGLKRWYCKSGTLIPLEKNPKWKEEKSAHLELEHLKRERAESIREQIYLMRYQIRTAKEDTESKWWT